NIQYVASPGFILEDSELAYSADEGLHAVGSSNSAPTDMILRRNWIHDQGNTSIAGHMRGTPSGLLVGDDTANSTTNNWTGTVIEGNLIENQGYDAGYSSPGYGVRIEGSVSNAIFRNNVIRNTGSGTGAPCIVLSGYQGTQGTAWST